MKLHDPRHTRTRRLARCAIYNRNLVEGQAAYFQMRKGSLTMRACFDAMDALFEMSGGRFVSIPAKP